MRSFLVAVTGLMLFATAMAIAMPTKERVIRGPSTEQSATRVLARCASIWHGLQPIAMLSLRRLFSGKATRY